MVELRLSYEVDLDSVFTQYFVVYQALSDQAHISARLVEGAKAYIGLVYVKRPRLCEARKNLILPAMRFISSSSMYCPS